jgi:hypothetical protein
MKLQFSDRDRAVAALTLKVAPWGGGEERMLRLYAIKEALNLAPIVKRWGDTPLEDIPSSPSSPVVLPADLVELLVEILCGENRGFKAEFAEHAAELVVRIRKVRPKKTNTDKQEQTP